MKGLKLMANRRMTVNKLKELVKLYEKNLDKTLIAKAIGIYRGRYQIKTDLESIRRLYNWLNKIIIF